MRISQSSNNSSQQHSQRFINDTSNIPRNGSLLSNKATTHKGEQNLVLSEGVGDVNTRYVSKQVEKVLDESSTHRLTKRGNRS
jgi:DNA/RNA endonuclease YhcR with UshA esterase domain